MTFASTRKVPPGTIDLVGASDMRTTAPESRESPMQSMNTVQDAATATPPTDPSPVGTTNPIRVLLVDDKLIVREGVRALLDREPGFHVVAQAGSVAEAMTLDVRPDVVITDLVLTDAHATEIVPALRSHFGHAAIFVLTDDNQRARLEQMVSTDGPGGARGYLLKTASAAEFLTGLRTVAQGVSYIQLALRTGSTHRQTAVTSASVASDDPARTTVNTLTEKEREVLRYLVLGHTNAEIATLTAVSLRTVEARRARLLSKLGVRTRAELVRVAWHNADILARLA